MNAHNFIQFFIIFQLLKKHKVQEQDIAFNFEDSTVQIEQRKYQIITDNSHATFKCTRKSNGNTGKRIVSISLSYIVDCDCNGLCIINYFNFSKNGSSEIIHGFKALRLDIRDDEDLGSSCIFFLPRFCLLY